MDDAGVTENKGEETKHPVTITPFQDVGEPLVARLVCIRAPMQNEGPFTMAELELHTKSGNRGRISLPYITAFGNLGSYWKVDIILREAEQRDYLLNRADTLDLVREVDTSPIVGVV